MSDLTALGALQARDKLAIGEITCEQLTAACLARVAAVDGQIDAWAYLDQEYAMAQAKALDDHRQAGKPIGPLHGVPVAVKDIFDTKDMPTENGTAIDAGRRPSEDATAVTRLREAGALILGKTVTTELALFGAGKTRNPHNQAHTPGGSSSGSAAAVASGMAPLAIGSQTAGSVIRPASFCGVVGYKPSHGLISRHGVLGLSRALDTIGSFGRSVEDAALVAEAMIGYDPLDQDTRPAPRPRLAELALTEPPVRPVFAMVTQPAWEQAEPDLQGGFAELAEVLGEDCDEVELPAPFAEATDLHRTIMLADTARALAGYHERGADQLTPRLCEMIEEGRKTLAFDYTLALDWVKLLNAGLDEIFERYDAIITPAALGPAPAGEATGDPVYCVLWTLCGVPAVSLPLLRSESGLPIGVQLVGRRGDDGRLLRTARWLARHLAELDQGDQAGAATA
ncbi:MAG: amidase [Pseudomonadota bacterium]